MRKISPKVLKQVLDRKVPGDCERSLEGNCEGRRPTLEHAIIYAGRQLDESWAIIKLCAKHHGVDEWQDSRYLIKEINQLIALNYATDKELEAISKLENYQKKREYLRDKYPDYA